MPLPLFRGIVRGLDPFDAHQERTGDTRGAEATKRISPIAWQHINLHGRFEFLKPPDGLNVDTIIRALTTPHAGRVVNLFP